MSESDEFPRTQPQGDLGEPPRHPPTAVAAATPPRPPHRERAELREAPWLFRAVKRGLEVTLDALDTVGDGVATLVGLRK